MKRMYWVIFLANVASHRIPLASGIRGCSAAEMREVPKARDSVDWSVELSRCAAKCEEGFRAGWKEEGEVHEGI